MTIAVIPPAFCDHSSVADDGTITLPEGARLRDVLRMLKIPPLLSRVLISAVNYERVTPNHPLKDGDTVSFFSILGGG